MSARGVATGSALQSASACAPCDCGISGAWWLRSRCRSLGRFYSLRNGRPGSMSVMAMLRQLTADLRLEVELRFIPTIDGVAYSGGTLHGETIIPVSGSP